MWDVLECARRQCHAHTEIIIFLFYMIRRKRYFIEKKAEGKHRLQFVFFIIDTRLVKRCVIIIKQEAQLSPSDRAMRLVSSNLASCHATVQKLLIRQVLTKLMV